jgi:hypothetical protein
MRMIARRLIVEVLVSPCGRSECTAKREQRRQKHENPRINLLILPVMTVRSPASKTSLWGAWRFGEQCPGLVLALGKQPVNTLA